MVTKPKTKPELLEYLFDLLKNRKLRKASLISQVESLSDAVVEELLTKVDIDQAVRVDVQAPFNLKKSFDDYVSGVCMDTAEANTPINTAAFMPVILAAIGEGKDPNVAVKDYMQQIKQQRIDMAADAQKQNTGMVKSDSPKRRYTKIEVVDALLKASHEGKLMGNPTSPGDHGEYDLIPKAEIALPNELQKIAEHLYRRGLLSE